MYWKTYHSWTFRLRLGDCIEFFMIVKPKVLWFYETFLYSLLYNIFFYFSMKHSLKATSIIEAMIVLLIVVSWITGVYTILNSSQKLAISTWNRIEAIQIARDWLEAFTNIRDTNWILYSADYENCWNTYNYDATCIWSSGTSTDTVLWASQGFWIYKNSNNQFELIKHWWIMAWYSDSTYRTNFRVQKDSNWFYTQSWSVDFNPIYTREIQISYPDGDSDTDRIEVTALVLWSDSSSSAPQKVEMSTMLTNWKAKQ